MKKRKSSVLILAAFAVLCSSWVIGKGYKTDNIPFKNQLIAINNSIDYFVFHKASNKRVILGEDQWLFYDCKDDGDPIGSYQGTNLFTESDLLAIKNNCIAQRDFLASQGKEFVIFIVPNKERIYCEYFPDRYGEPADRYRTMQVVEYLRENTDLRVVYPYEELMETKKILEENIYCKTDSHWNEIGGYVGARALLGELGIEMPEITESRIKISKGENRSGDLAKMLGLSKQLQFYDVEYRVEGYDTHDARTIQWDLDDECCYQTKNADPRKIYVLGDSFGIVIADYIGSQYQESCMKYNLAYSYEDFREEDPDIFVVETVERYIEELSRFSVK